MLNPPPPLGVVKMVEWGERLTPDGGFRSVPSEHAASGSGLPAPPSRQRPLGSPGWPTPCPEHPQPEHSEHVGAILPSLLHEVIWLWQSCAKLHPQYSCVLKNARLADTLSRTSPGRGV